MYNVVLSGAVLNSDNLGCLALTYSAVKMLEDIAADLGVNFTYTILELSFDGDRSTRGRDLMCAKLGINASKVDVIPMGSSLTARARVRHFVENCIMRKNVKNSLALFDLTAGDSFSDIYGMERLSRYAEPMTYALATGTPLILGPQTYGPFVTSDGSVLANSIFAGSSLAIARDEMSAICFQETSGKTAFVSTDLAFGLPFDKKAIPLPETYRPRVGLNVSGLLYDDNLENTKKLFELKTNYRDFTHQIIEELTKADCEVHLIPHVGADVAVNSALANKYSGIVAHSLAETPIDAKNLVCQMDLMIGSRMHATIAALSSGTPVVPVAYSRKFKGLFDGVGYKHGIDLTSCETYDAVIQTLSLCKETAELKKDVNSAQLLARRKLDEGYTVLKDCLAALLPC